MKNSLFRRISRIVTANIENIIKSSENINPGAVLEQAINEVEEVIADIRQDLAAVLTNKHLATKELTVKNNQHDKLNEQVKIALDVGKEQLAKAGIAEQLDIEAQIPILEKTILDCHDEEKQLESYITALKAKINEMTLQIRNLSEIKKDNSSILSQSSDHQQKLHEAQKTFNRVYQNVLSEKGSSFTSLDRLADLKDLENLEREKLIQGRLQNLKKEGK